ncbi:hypothetical protein [Chitinophaga filiformis]|uniref:CcmD family protein n=1 Tax=Chitinophaga filiformis TaxID=104663 RepID=A0ABY4IBT7_CHIFI|nr:hypothetical protein [Chitinophaga filiformis]UPK72266.1 hypothetical protein MYF79_13310 [Chitinophaga filiformis]
MNYYYGSVIVVIGILILLIALYVALVRWVLRINDIVFYLDKINEKLHRLEQRDLGSEE